MKYSGFLLATVGGVSTVAAGAQAADLPYKAPMMAAPAVSWQGWYAGLSAGGAWQNMGGVSQDYGGTSYSSTSFIGGGQLGYNWQHGTFVYGVEADISGLTHGFRQAAAVVGKGMAYKSDIEWLATFRGRAGLAVNDTLVYMTGGLAVGGVKNLIAPNGDLGTGVSKSESKTKVGWVIGGGIEHMWTRNLTVGLEALFVDLGHSTAQASNLDASKTTRFSNQAVIGRLKVNYKF
jgi:outer membrane immunogenic protein